MADIQQALMALLRGDAEIAAVVGTRVYPSPLRQTPVLPDITMYEVSEQHDQLLGVAHPRWQLTPWSKTYLEARQIAQLIDYCLQRYKGTSEGVQIISCHFQGKRDIYDPEVQLHLCPVDIQLKYWEED